MSYSNQPRKSWITSEEETYPFVYQPNTTESCSQLIWTEIVQSGVDQLEEIMKQLKTYQSRLTASMTMIPSSNRITSDPENASYSNSTDRIIDTRAHLYRRIEQLEQENMQLRCQLEQVQKGENRSKRSEEESIDLAHSCQTSKPPQNDAFTSHLTKLHHHRTIRSVSKRFIRSKEIGSSSPRLMSSITANDWLRGKPGDFATSRPSSAPAKRRVQSSPKRLLKWNR